MTNGLADQQATTRTTPQREGCLTGVMTEARVSGRSNLDPGDAGDGRSDIPMNVAMEMATAARPGAVETTGAMIV